MTRMGGPSASALLEAMDDAAIVLDARGRVRAWNGGAADLYALPADAALGRPFDALVRVAWSAPGDAERYAAALADGGRWRGPCRHEVVGGRALSVEVSLGPVRRGRAGWSLLVVRPTSGADAALEAAREDLRRLERLGRLGVLVVDLHPVRARWSAPFERLTGIGPTEMPSDPEALIERAVHPDDRARVRDAYRRLRDAGESFEVEYRLVRRDGEQRWVQALGTTERGPDGRTARLVGMFRDVTRRKRAEIALAETSRFVERVTQAVPFAIYVYDLRVGTDVYVNPATTRLFGYESAEIEAMGASLLEQVIHPDDFEKVGQLIAETCAAADDATVVGRYRLRHKSGEWRVVSSALVVFQRAPDGAPTQLLGAIEDVTERERNEAELERHRHHLEELVAARTRDLTAINAELEAFGSSLAHDLRSPLRTIAAMAEFALEDAGDGLAEAARDHLQRIIASVTRANDLIDGLMRLAHAIRRPIEVEPVDLGALAREVVEEQRAAAPDQPVEVQIEGDLRVAGDRALLRVLLANLVQNAWKFSGDRHPAHVEIGRAPADGALVLCYVRDDGVGFDPRHAARIFDAFERLHPPGAYPGSGIGLATARQVVRRHGGRIWATGTPGGGATFWFTLPKV